MTVRPAIEEEHTERIAPEPQTAPGVQAAACECEGNVTADKCVVYFEDLLGRPFPYHAFNDVAPAPERGGQAWSGNRLRRLG